MTLTRDQLLTRIHRDLTDQSTDLSFPESYNDGIDDMLRETGWSFSLASNFKELWGIQRSIRWILYRLMIASARKFKAEGFALDQKYQHYKELISVMDAEWKDAAEANSHELAGVDINQLFGTYASAGFSTNTIGEDSTYDDNNEVKTFPESDET